ncbi:MAG: hypothetical protein WBZ36_22140, partial [Candidatus Nitrosopolaris sp.]
ELGLIGVGTIALSYLLPKSETKIVWKKYRQCAELCHPNWKKHSDALRGLMDPAQVDGWHFVGLDFRIKGMEQPFTGLLDSGAGIPVIDAPTERLVKRLVNGYPSKNGQKYDVDLMIDGLDDVFPTSVYGSWKGENIPKQGGDTLIPPSIFLSKYSIVFTPSFAVFKPISGNVEDVTIPYTFVTKSWKGLPFYINDVKQPAILDSGSDISTIRTETAKKVGIIDHLKPLRVIYSDKFYSYYNVPISLEGVGTIMALCVVTNSDLDIISGTQWTSRGFVYQLNMNSVSFM